MLRHSSIRVLVGLWVAWVVVILGYQAIVGSRYTVLKPDTVLPWTARETAQATSPYLKQPFLNAQVAWDSEFYLSIALNGYDDPAVRTIPSLPEVPPPLDRPLSLNYAFFPMYPLLIRLVALPLSGLGLGAIATATLAGVVISCLGTLAAMVALFELASPAAGESGGLRAAFYLVAFPTGFFLAQVYTEGLFLGLAFSCLALLQRPLRWHWFGAIGLATIATLTKAVGVALIIPLALAWVQALCQAQFRLTWQRVIAGLAILTPAIVLALWKRSVWGQAFSLVEKHYFQCEPLAWSRAAGAWGKALLAVATGTPQSRVYFAIELAALLLGVVACVTTLRRQPGLSAFGLVVLLVSSTCGIAQGMHRYSLAVPSVFLALSQWGTVPLFDRVWTLISVLLLGLLTSLFSFDLWVG